MELRIVTARPFNASTPVAALREDVTPPRMHYVRDHFDRPALVDESAYRLRVGGLVERSLLLDLASIRALAVRTETVTLECAGNGRTRMQPTPPGTPWDDGAVSTARWTGARLADVLVRAAPRRGAVEVVFRGADRGVEGGREMRYERSLPIEDALAPHALLVFEKDGAPLTALHGGPLRLVVPGWYGMASVKWLDEVEVAAEPFRGWFQHDRYVYADETRSRVEPVRRMRVKSLLTRPLPGESVPAGTRTTIEGRAWCGEAEVARVDVSTDGGATWTRATLDGGHGPFAWRRFTAPWTPEPGIHVLVARATDAEGRAQPLEPPWNKYGYGMNAVVPVQVRAE